MLKKYDIVVIMSTSWSGRHEGKHTHYIGEPGIVDKKSLGNGWYYVLVVPDDVHADVALYHETNLSAVGLKVDREVTDAIWERHGRQGHDAKDQ